MPRYIIERNVGTVTEADLEAASRRSNDVLKEMKDIVWVRSYASHSEGKAYCEYEAPSKEAVHEHARRAGLPADRITEIDLGIVHESGPREGERGGSLRGRGGEG